MQDQGDRQESVAELHMFETEIRIRTPFVVEFVGQFKKRIPAGHRRWDPDDRMWIISYTYEGQAVELCKKFYGRIERYRHKPQSGSKPPEAYRTLHLLPTAPQQLIYVAYKTLKKLEESGKNNPEKLHKLKEAYDKITEW